MSMEELKRRNEMAKVTAAATDLNALKAQRSAEIDLHLKLLGDEQQEYTQVLNFVVQAGIRQRGLPTAAGAEIFTADCEALAARIVAGRRNREWSQNAALLEQLNARDPNQFHLLAAKRNGVALPVTVEPPKLVQG